MTGIGEALVWVLIGGAAFLWKGLRHVNTEPDAAVGVPDDTCWAAARHLGLSIPFDRYWPVTGKVDGVPVELEVHAGSERRIVVRIVAPCTDLLSLARGQRLTDELVVGEARFDDVFHVSCPDPLVGRALLDGPTRDTLAAAGAVGAALHDGRMALDHPLGGWGEREVVKAVRTLVRAHQALRGRAAAVRNRPAAAVNEIARGDRSATVRLRSVEELLRRGVAERDTLRSRLDDVDVAVRLAAAHALGAEGHAALEKLVRTGSRSVRVRAAGLLSSSGALPSSLVPLVEDTFLAALDDAELVSTALMGLARRGTARSVVPVLELAQGERRVDGALPSADVRRTAEAVLKAVRARLDAGAAGGVSMATLETGELALLEAAGGDVGLTDE